MYLLQKHSRDAVSFSRACGQPSVIAEMAFIESSLKKALLAADERSRIERSRADIDQSAVNEVADFNRSDWPLRDIDHFANVNSLLFAPIVVIVRPKV